MGVASKGNVLRETFEILSQHKFRSARRFAAEAEQEALIESLNKTMFDLRLNLVGASFELKQWSEWYQNSGNWWLPFSSDVCCPGIANRIDESEDIDVKVQTEETELVLKSLCESQDARLAARHANQQSGSVDITNKVVDVPQAHASGAEFRDQEWEDGRQGRWWYNGTVICYFCGSDDCQDLRNFVVRSVGRF